MKIENLKINHTYYYLDYHSQYILQYAGFSLYHTYDTHEPYCYKFKIIKTLYNSNLIIFPNSDLIISILEINSNIFNENELITSINDL